MRIFLLIAGITLLFMGGIGQLAKNDSFVDISIGDAEIRAQLADAPEERATGLSSHASLPEDEGMLFVFQTESRHRFWMKDMRFPVDIIWINKEKRVAEITRNVSPDSYPERFIPASPVLYVLEVNAGWAEEHGIQVGDEVRF